MSTKSNKRTWTPQQKTAIETRNKTILVSAAAGSGKTATLTERIIQRITIDNADISNMLIVTFTRSAAADLKAKIFSAISDKLATVTDSTIASKLSAQLANINNASICTIDSFYYELIKSHFTECGVSPTFRIIDDGEYKLIAKQTINEVIDEAYENDPEFPRFADCFSSVKNINSLGDKFLKIYTILSSSTEGIEFLKRYSELTKSNATSDFMQSKFGELLKAETIRFYNHYIGIFDYIIEEINKDEGLQKKYNDTITASLLLCQSVLTALENNATTYAEIKNIVESYTVKDALRNRIPTTELSEKIKKLRKEFNAEQKKHTETYYSSSAETINRAMNDSANYINTLYLVLKRFDEKMAEQKHRLDFLTFNDISRKTYGLLVNNGQPTEIAKKISEEYTDIYIDEYQDVDPLQNQIFSAISTPTNRFMVGDIKQSIYKFRGAEPTLFSSLRKEFPDISVADNSDTATIFMSNNFRCDKHVIDFTNLVCSCIFRQIGGCVEYTKDDDLVFSKITDKSQNEDATTNIEDKLTQTVNKVKVSVISIPNSKKSASSDNDKNSDKDTPKETSAESENSAEENVDEECGSLEWESEYIASQIQELLKSGKKSDGSPINPGDIAVLFRKQKISPYLSLALRRRGIKVAETEATQYFENDDVLLMLCVLNTIDNPERDIYLAGTLRSPLFDFTADELLTLRREYNDPCSLFYGLCKYAKTKNDELAKKCSDFYDTLLNWQETAQSLPIDRFLLNLFNNEKFIASGILSNQSSEGEGGNVLLLYDYARSFQGKGFKGLYEFIEYINSLIDEGQSFPATSKRDAPDRVTLMTIHKSKGLEFPVCFLSLCGNKFNNEDAKQNLVLSYPEGIAMKLSDDSGFSLITTPMHSLIASKMYEECVEEEIRVLYVALTRAREQLFITGVFRSTVPAIKEKIALRAEFTDRYTVVSQCNTYLDWILLALNGNEFDFSEIEYITPENIKIALDETDKANDNSLDDPIETEKFDNELYFKLINSFSFEYPYYELSKVPSKLSVSRLYPDILDEFDTSCDLFIDQRPATVPEFFSSVSPTANAAERGTATHLFLQFCNFEYAATHGIKEELERLCELKYLPSNIKDLIYIDELEKFIDSELLIEILSAKKIIREQRFNVSLSPDGFTKNNVLLEKMKGEKLAVQGVIDLILITKDDKIKLYDYKTDRLTKEELNSDELAKEKLSSKHAQQLSYYAMACKEMFGKKCDTVQIYSTHSAKLYDIEISEDFKEII